MCRKSTDIHALKQDMETLMRTLNTAPEQVNIDRVIELKHMEFYDFKENLLEDREWLKDTGGEIILVKETGADDQSGIIVQTSGFEYARYSGLPMQKVDYKKCPRCGKIYTEHPAISRTDNKTEICSHCGIEEALEAAGYSLKFIELLDDLHTKADKFKIQIDVKVPKYENGKKTTEKIVIKPNMGYNEKKGGNKNG